MTTRPEAVLAIDLGTTAVKAGLVGMDGELLAEARVDAGPMLGESPDRAEQDPRTWWDAVVRATRELTSTDIANVVAIAPDGHGPTLVAVDARGEPTRPAITWLDARAAEELRELSGATGLRGWALGVLPAALWVERHEPDVAHRTASYLNTWEYLALRLSGCAATTLVDGQRLPSRELLHDTGIDGNRLPAAIAAGTVIGPVVPNVARELQLPAGTPVVSGMVDAFASFHGAGLADAGDAIDTGGVSGGFGVYWDRAIEAAGSFCTPAPLPGLHIVGGAMAATGAALDWFVDDIVAADVSRDQLIAEAAATPPGADGLIFLPYLAGERSPLWDPHARGAFVGLTLRHGRGHMVRAILEAAAFAIRHVAKAILAAGVRVDAMRVCGGPARSRAWNRIKADVTGFPVLVPRTLDTTVVGMGIVGAVAIGSFPDLRAGITAMARIDETLTPARETRDMYDALFESYVGLYPAISPLVHG